METQPQLAVSAPNAWWWCGAALDPSLAGQWVQADEDAPDAPSLRDFWRCCPFPGSFLFLFALMRGFGSSTPSRALGETNGPEQRWRRSGQAVFVKIHIGMWPIPQQPITPGNGNKGMMVGRIGGEEEEREKER